jgi:hypothetical protein
MPPKRFYIAQIAGEVLLGFVIVLLFSPESLTAQFPLGTAIIAENIRSPLSTSGGALATYLIIVVSIMGVGSLFPRIYKSTVAPTEGESSE